MKVKDVLDKTVQFFKEKKFETPRLDTEILLSEALEFKNRVDLYLKFDQPIQEAELNKCRDFVRRRSQGEPVAYIIGKKDFYGFAFLVNSAVLIPRPETELLVEQALAWCAQNDLNAPKILDLGCGSGCIGLAMLKKLPEAQLVAVDKSADAIQVARQNAEALEVAERCEFVNADALSVTFPAKFFDVILANPPYIAEDDPQVDAAVKKYEPASALFAAENGLADVFNWSSHAQKWLKEKSFMGFEMGATQGESVQSHFEAMQTFDQIRIVKDLAGLDRHVIGEKNG